MTGSSEDAPPSDRVRVRRGADHASYDRAVVDAVLDAAVVGHVGIVGADGQPFVLPVAVARHGDEVLMHGSIASRLLRAGAAGESICLTVTLLDGLVFARSLFESSMRYRSVVVVGRPREIVDPAEKLAALDVLSGHLMPGRAAEVRASTDVEVRQTKVIALRLDEVSAKVNHGWPDDPPEDLAGDAWAGVLPLTTVAGDPLPAPGLRPGIEVPESVRRSSERRF